MVFSHSIFIHSSAASVEELSSRLMPKARQERFVQRPLEITSWLMVIVAVSRQLSLTAAFQPGEPPSTGTGPHGWNVGNKSPTQREHFGAGACLASPGCRGATQ